MASTVRHVGVHNAAIGFPLLERRSIAVNTANLQIAVGNEQTGATTGVALPLLAIRYFSVTAQYITGDFVIYSGQIYKAITTVTPGAFNVGQWVGMTDGGQFLLRDGTREMYGNLEIQKPGASLVLNAEGASQADVWFRRDGLTRWLIRSKETAEVDLVIARFDSGGFVIDTPLVISRATGRVSVLSNPTLPLELAPKQYVDALIAANSASDRVLRAGDVMTGALSVPVLYIDSHAGAASDLWFRNADVARWLIRAGDPAADNFELHHYDAAGAYLGAAMVLENATGNASFQNVIRVVNGLQFGGNAATGFYGDGTNVAIRTHGNNTIYFQNATGTLSYGHININGMHVEGNIDARQFVATWGDGLQNTVPAGNNARTWWTVIGARAWSMGTLADGRLVIHDESAATWRMIINLDGSVQFNGPVSVNGRVTATEFYGPSGPVGPGGTPGEVPSMEGVYYIDFRHPGDAWDYSARIITMNNSPSPGGLSNLNIICFEQYTGGMHWNFFRGREGSAPGARDEAFEMNFWARLPPEMAAFRLWFGTLDVASIAFNFGLRRSTVRDVVPLRSMWEPVKRLNPVRLKRPHLFEHTETLAFVADEVRDALGERSVVDLDPKGEPDTIEPLAMIAVLTKALQEAMQRIEALEARLA